jgi:hypothetical protein
MALPLTSGFRVTARDLEILCWIGRQRFAEAGQVARRFAMDERNTYRRLRGLVRGELLDHRRVFHAVPGVYIATRFGLAAAGLVLPGPRLDIRTYAHDLAAVSLLIELEAEFGRAALRTERELRSRDAGNPERPRYAVRRGTNRGRRGLHFPDLAVELDGDKPLAVEIELTAKGATRLDSIVWAYVRGRHIASVRYYAARAAVLGVERAVGRAGAQDLFDIRKLEEHDSCSISNHTVAAA